MMFRRLGYFLTSVFRRRRLEQDVDEELRASFEMLVDRFVARGLPPAEAHRLARLEFGIEQVKEEVRDGLRRSALTGSFQDLRYAWRALRRWPAFTVVALVTLALGIGVNTAVFSLFYAVLLRPLPYGDPGQLVILLGNFKETGAVNAVLSGPILVELQRRNRSLSGVAGLWAGTGIFTGGNPEQVRLAQVTPNFFDVLGVRAAYGRTFTKEERAGGRPAIILNNGFFQSRFAGNVNLIGAGLPMRTAAATLIGVLPPDFQLHFSPETRVPANVEAFTPFNYDIGRSPRKLYFIRALGRMKPGVTIGQARRDLERVAAELRAAYTEYAAEDLHFTVLSMQAAAVRDIRPALVVLFAGASFLLMICCVNVSGLLLARAADRRKEIALRLAVGASRGRIVRQLIAEGGVLCLIGGAAGVGVGWAVFRVLLAVRPERFSRLGDAGLNWPALAFVLAASFVAALFSGLAPAIESFRVDLMETLHTAGRGWLGALHRRSGQGLVIAEIAIAFVLVTGAALTARTLAKIEQVRPGFEPRHLLTFQLSFGSLLNPAVQFSVIREWENQLAALPGVERVGATSHLPLDDFPNWYSPYRPEGVSAGKGATLLADHRCVTPGYFAAMGTRLLEGRLFDRHDGADGRPVYIVDELLARSAWPGQSPIGKKLEAERVVRYGFAPVTGVVVGMVEHMRNHSLTREVRGELYIPYEQSPRSPLTYVLRTRVEPLSLVPAIREMLHRRDPTLALAKVRPMTDYVARDIAPAGFTALVAAMFSALALLLAAAGIYGVLNYHVSRRLPEMGIRMAVGAGAWDVFRLVMGEGLALAAIGSLLGTAAAFAAARWLGALVYGVSPHDPLSYAIALLLLPAIALFGCWRPARRAASADPVRTIREQ